MSSLSRALSQPWLLASSEFGLTEKLDRIRSSHGELGGWFTGGFQQFPLHDIDRIIAAMKDRIDYWYVATLPPARGATAHALHERLRFAGVGPDAIREFADAGDAYRAARDASAEADRIVVFGSFLTVAAALAQMSAGAL